MANRIIGGNSAVGRTEFQLHISQFQSYSAKKHSLFDFTEARLVQYLLLTTDEEKRTIVTALLEEYRQGKIAVAWRAGEPVYVRMNKIV